MEKILNILGSKKPFDRNGELTESGAKAYEKLITILDELNNVGAIDKSVDDLEAYFDEIIDQGY